MSKETKLTNQLIKQKISLAVAESCTGGYLSYLLTQTPGSSRIFKGAIICYSLDVKHKILKLPIKLLTETDGVSEKVAQILAENVRKLFKSQLGVSIVGFAGPKAKPGVKVGTTFIAVTDGKTTQTKRLILKGTRDQVRKKAAEKTCDYLLQLTSPTI